MIGHRQILTTFALLGLASAACQLSNGLSKPLKPPLPAPYKDKALCVSQGKGDWTFSLWDNQVEVPTFNGGNPNAGSVSDYVYLIYDHTCALRGIYSPKGNDCGLPFVIEENFLKQVLKIFSESLDLGGESFAFYYGNGEFSTGNNQCGCSDMSSGLEGATGCKCGFPVSGVL